MRGVVNQGDLTANEREPARMFSKVPIIGKQGEKSSEHWKAPNNR